MNCIQSAAVLKPVEVGSPKNIHALFMSTVDTAQTELSDFSVTDAATNQYGSAEQRGSRYVIRQTVVVRSDRKSVV